MASTAPAAGDIPEGETHCIFICGATEAKDLWMFADFMATSKVFLNTGGIRGTYINTWPIQDFLAKNNRVAWGYEGPDTDTPLIVYNKTETSWWKDITLKDSKHIPSLLLQKLERIGKTARYPDKVNLFMFCHGSSQGWLQLGDGKLKMSDLSRTIATKFDYGIQVNVISAACYSGTLLDKIKDRDNRRRSVQTSAAALEKSFSNSRLSTSNAYRESPFVTAYTSSLVLGLQATNDKTPSRTLQEHIDLVNQCGISAGKSSIGHPQSYHDGSHGALDAVLNLFFRSYNVETIEGGEKVRQRFFKSPLPGAQLPSGAASSAAVSASAEKIHIFVKGIKHEMDQIRCPEGRTIFESCSENDKDFFSNIHGMNSGGSFAKNLPLFKEVLLGLRWRFQLQERYLFIFDELLRDELLSEKAVAIPMDILHENDAVEHIAQLLEGFDLGAVCRLFSNQYPALSGKVGHGGFEMPLRWLAILILRSYPETELQHIVARFVTTKHFGEYHESNVEFLKPFRTKHMPNANFAQDQYHARSYELGFFLPHGIAGEKFKLWAEHTEVRYTHIRDIFEELHGKGTWGDSTQFLRLLKAYKTHTLEEWLGPRLRQGESYIDDMSPVSATSSSGFSAVTSASSKSSAPSSAGDFALPKSKK